jgi:hypothetical protein
MTEGILINITTSSPRPGANIKVTATSVVPGRPSPVSFHCPFSTDKYHAHESQPPHKYHNTQLIIQVPNKPKPPPLFFALKPARARLQQVR